MGKFGIKKRQKVGEVAVKIVEALLKQDGCKIQDTGCEKKLNKNLLFRLRYRKQPKDYLLRFRPDKLVTTPSGKRVYVEVKSASAKTTFISYTQFVWNYFHNKVHPVYYAFVNRQKGTVVYCKYGSIKVAKVHVFKCRKYRYYANKDKNCLLVASTYHKTRMGTRKDFVKESKWSYEPSQKWFRYKGLFLEITIPAPRTKLPK